MLERETSASRGGRSCEAVGEGVVDVSGKERKVADSGPVKGAMMQSAKRRLAKMRSKRRGDALGRKPKRWTK